MGDFVCQPIGVVHSCFKEKFGIPRQPGLAPAATGRIEIYPPFGDPQAFEGLEHCSHIWVQFIFHANKPLPWRPRVRPPRLGGNQSLGVFATRSPNRPNAIGLSVVALDGITHAQGRTFLEVSGIDLLHGSPVLDIKPYVPYVDAVAGAHNAIAPQAPALLPVGFSASAQDFCRRYQKESGVAIHVIIEQVLQQDPRPSYQAPGARIYVMALLDVQVHWQCLKDGEQMLISVQEIEQDKQKSEK